MSNDTAQMPRYQSFKTVSALEIAGVFGNDVTFVDPAFKPVYCAPDMFVRYTPVAGDFLVHYSDGYKSFSPRKAFLEGYSAEKGAKHNGLPVAGYKPQSESSVTLVNANKTAEERLLRTLDELKDDIRVDQRWLVVARTHFEQGFMAMNRSIFRPGRVKLPGDPA